MSIAFAPLKPVFFLFFRCAVLHYVCVHVHVQIEMWSLCMLNLPSDGCLRCFYPPPCPATIARVSWYSWSNGSYWDILEDPVHQFDGVNSIITTELQAEYRQPRKVMLEGNLQNQWMIFDHEMDPNFRILLWETASSQDTIPIFMKDVRSSVRERWRNIQGTMLMVAIDLHVGWWSVKTHVVNTPYTLVN